MSFKNAPKKKESNAEPAFDLEQQFILRMPPGPAMALRHDVQSGSMTLKDKLSIDLQPDGRRGQVRYGNEIFNAKLVDLPCIMESLKTVDKKTFYKTADICQMLICSNDDDTLQEENESPKKKDKKNLWPHGITPPLKNVKKRRFRKTLKKKYMEQPDIEKEVKRLFRTDAEAIDVKWEVVVEEEKASESGGNTTSHQGTVINEEKPSGKQPRNDTSSLDLAIFGELSSSEEEDDKDVNIMDSGEDEMSHSSFMPRQMSFASIDTAASESQDMVNDAESAELQLKLTELKRQVEEIRLRRKSQEEKLATLENPMLRQRMQAMLDQTIEEENEKGQEYEILSSMLAQS